MTKKTKTAAQNAPKKGQSGQALAETDLNQVAGGSFSWGMSNTQLCDGSVRPASENPAALLPAVQKPTN